MFIFKKRRGFIWSLGTASGSSDRKKKTFFSYLFPGSNRIGLNGEWSEYIRMAGMMSCPTVLLSSAHDRLVMGELGRTDGRRDSRRGQDGTEDEEDAQLMTMKMKKEEGQSKKNKQNPNKPIQLNLYLFNYLTQLNSTYSLSNPYPYPTLPYFIPILFYSIHNRLTD